MIDNIRQADITLPNNPSDIIIAMNQTLSEVTGIGLSFVRQIKLSRPLVRGSVLSFEFTPARNVHVLICHKIGPNGWVDADKYVRFGMDFLWRNDAALLSDEGGFDRPKTAQPRRYSIVEIGTGRVGRRDGADHAAIRRAMEASHLHVDLYLYKPPARDKTVSAIVTPLRPFQAYHPLYGMEHIAA